MQIFPTTRLYLSDDHCFEASARITTIRENLVAFDQSCFYPGGGGQPPDEGMLRFSNGEMLGIETAYAELDDVIWHVCKTGLSLSLVNEAVELILNKKRRLALMRYHTVLHVLNTITLREYGGWITGVQIKPDYSRIDFKLENFSPSVTMDLETRVNQVLEENHVLKSHYITEQEFQQRTDLLRTLEARPPIHHGKVRVVEIEGFDAQACGGTHLHNTSEAGRCSIFRTDNKGKNNKRFYIRLDPSG